MGHLIVAYSDEALTDRIAYISLFSSEATEPGNIYDVLGVAEFRGQCSGTGGVAKFRWGEENYKCDANERTKAFFDELLRKTADNGVVWLSFQ